MKPILLCATLCVALVTSCAGCTKLHLWFPSHVIAMDPDKSAIWLVGEWQSSGAKQNAADPAGEAADWIVTAGDDRVFHFQHGKLQYEVDAIAFADEQQAAMLEVTLVSTAGSRRKDSVWYVARLEDEVLSIKPVGSDSLRLDEKVRTSGSGIDNGIGLMALHSAN